MPQMAREGKNGYGLPREKVACRICKEVLPQNKFSYVVKNDPSKGIRTSCKTCAAKKALEEKERRENNWKYKPSLHMLNNSKQRAKEAGFEHSLLLEDIVIPDICPVLGIKLETGNRKSHYNAPSIDRIDNSKGYTKDNIMVISTRANLIKKDATLDELIMIGNFYQNFKGV